MVEIEFIDQYRKKVETYKVSKIEYIYGDIQKGDALSDRIAGLTIKFRTADKKEVQVQIPTKSRTTKLK